MIGIVVVCHSRALARAAVALAEEMVHGKDVRIAVAAGLDETTFGTDAVAIVDALTSADRGDGVVVLMDLGSAVLSAELALDLLDDDQLRERVILCPAPIVEGLVVAAVAAASGLNAAEVADEALAALAGKQAHFGQPTEPSAEAPPAAAGELVGRFTVPNPHGLHARPAARLVQQLRPFDARVELRNVTTGSAWVSATSLSKVATLGALHGHHVEARADGPQAQQALDGLLALAGAAFGEADGAATTPPPVVEAAPPTAPLGASPGIGIGPAWPARSDRLAVPDAHTDDPHADWLRLIEAIAAARREIQRVRARAALEIGADEAAIFDAHLLLLDDADLLDDVHRRIHGGQAAAPAWSAAITGIAEELAALPEPYLQARAADIRAVGTQVLRALLGVAAGRHENSGVLIADDLTPAEAADLDRGQVAAIVLASGSPTAHSAILARARGIPTVVAAGRAVLDVASGTLLAVDGGTGEVVVDPSPDVLDIFRARAANLAAREQEALAESAAPAVTHDGEPVLVGANVGSVADARAAAAAGADLAGLVRTEFLFLDRTQPPDVEEQETIYRAIAEALDGRRITLRTLDVGGDKPLDYLPMPPEANPFLGVRGIRLSLARPQLLTDQLLAIVRVAHDTPVSLMFPMVSTLDELIAGRRMLDEAVTRIGRGMPPELQIGIMIEVPAAALKAAAFAPHVDFFSIGTNDLTQYAMAAERGNDAVAALGDPFDPGVLRLIDLVCRAAEDRVLIAVCGELAADERAAGVLVGLGVRELSVAPPAVPTVKHAVRGLSTRDAAALASAALSAHSAAAVRDLLGQVAVGTPSAVD